MQSKTRRRSAIEVEGILTLTLVVPTEEVDDCVLRGMELIDRHDWFGRHRGVLRNWTTITAQRHNAFVNNGLQVMLDRAYGIGGPPAAISHIGVTGDSTAVTATTTTLDDGATGDLSIKPFSPAASRASQTVDAGATFTETDVNFVMRKIGLLNSASDGNLIDAIGGGGASPYDDAFTLDLTSTSSFSLDLGIQVTLSAT